MNDGMAFPISWPKEAAVTIRSILLEMDRPSFTGWPVSLSAPHSDRQAPLKVKLSGPPLGRTGNSNA
ncbi:MAG: hypothetical protein WC722_04150 [Rhodospirillales bacterium]|jgi:hypothetical protein